MQVELSRNDELRVLSVFTGLSLSGEEQGGIDTMSELVGSMDIGENNECLIITRNTGGFSVAGRNVPDISNANVLSAAGLLLFALSPGLITMYAASALIGLSIGIGKNIISLRYSELIETKRYAHSGYAYNMFDSLFGMLGAALFTAAHVLSSNEEYILVIAGIVIVPTLLYFIVSRRGMVKK